MRKFFYVAAIVPFLCLTAAFVSKSNQLAMLEQRTDILKDQLEDYQFQIISLRQSKTYEDGLREGIENSKNAAYVNGYHNALKDQNIFSPIISANK